jgi:hypothetical protein
MQIKDETIKITFRQVEDLKNRFFNYVETFKHGEEKCTENAILKENHTIRVCNEILSIGSALGLSAAHLHLAEITALFHDFGRFEQYARFKTFADAKSVNHALLGIEIIERDNVLNVLSPPVEDLVCRVIQYHNRAELPDEETETCLFFAKLLRDADKLDIYRVVTSYYRQTSDCRNEALELDLPDTETISEGVYQSLMKQKIVNFIHVKNLNDFKLLQAGWVFDINFIQTLYAVHARGYLDVIQASLPDTDKVAEIFDLIRRHLGQKLVSRE